MKSLIIFIVLSFIFCVSAFAQNSSSCPTVSIAPHDELIKAGVNAIFTAKIGGIEAKNIVYKWTISVGTIIEGQSTSAIKVDTLGLDGQSITATVKIEGFPVGCQNNESGTANVLFLCCKDPMKIDEYGKISFRKEKIKLNVVAIALNKEKEIRASFIFYVSKKNRNLALKIRQANILKYLTVKHKISKGRIEFVDGGFGDYKTDIWLQPTVNYKY